MSALSPTFRHRALAVAACALTGGLVAGALAVPAAALVPEGTSTAVIGSGTDTYGRVSNLAEILDGHRAVDIAVTGSETLALLDDGSLVTTDAQWRIDNWVNSLDGKSIVDIESGYAGAFAILSDGSAVMIDPYPTAYPIATATAGKTFTAISGGRHAAAGLTTDGNVVAWGEDSGGNVSGVSTAGIDGNAVQVAMGLDHAIALLDDNTVVGWGYNSSGATSGATAAIDGGTVVKIAAGSYASYAVLGDGTVAVWGNQASTRSASIADTADGRFITGIDVYFDNIVLTFIDGMIAVVPSGTNQSDNLAGQIDGRRTLQVEVGEGFTVALLGEPSVKFSVLDGEVAGDDPADVAVTVDDSILIAAGPYLGGTDFSIEWDGEEIQASTTGDDGYASEVIEIPDSAEFGDHTVTFVADGEETSTTVTVAAGLVSVTPIISGTARVNETLTAAKGKWTAGTSFSYAWLRDGKVIPSATATTYTLAPADLGKAIQVRVTGTKTGYVPSIKTSIKTAKVAKGILEGGWIEIQGDAVVGETLTLVSDSWSPVTPKLSYQWFANSVAIAKATKATFKPTAAQVDKRISVRVTASATGYATTGRSSFYYGYVERATLNLPDHYVVGSPVVGQKFTIGWYNYPNTTPGISYTYQWMRDDLEIKGAKKATYTATKADLGSYVWVRIFASKKGYNPGYSERYVYDKIYAKAVKPGVLTVTGTAKVGNTLTLAVTNVPEGAQYITAWIRVKGSQEQLVSFDSTTYTVQASDVGWKIRAAALFSKVGLAPSETYSKFTKTVVE
jgi:hypothetical protein